MKAVDSQGYIIFPALLSFSRDIAAAKRFFKQAITNCAIKPKTVTTDKHVLYVKAISQSKTLTKNFGILIVSILE